MMTYKAKGDLLQTYALCQKVYTYQIFMCNGPLPKTYVSKIMLPLHNRVMDSFDTVDEKQHQCAMYYVCNLAAFFKEVYNHEKNYYLVVLQGK